MIRFSLKQRIPVSLLFILTSSVSSFAQVIDDPNSTGWATHRGMSGQELRQRFDSLQSQGYRLTDIDAYELNNQLRYSAVWQRSWSNTAAHWNVSRQSFDQMWQYYRARGYRLIDQEAYIAYGMQLFAGIWVENEGNLDWGSWYNLTDAQFRDKFDDLSSRGFLPVDIDAYRIGSQLRWSVIWVENAEGLAWRELRGMSSNGYAQNSSRFAGEGFRVFDIESYQNDSGQQRFAAIWLENENNRAWEARRNMTSNRYRNRWRQLRDRGFRPIDVEAYQTANGTRYAAVWRQEGSRHNWPNRQTVDQLVDGYRGLNAVPGISVAIADNGQIVYRRGFGDRDVEADLWADSVTVYRAASVCKPISSVLTMRLEDEGTIDIDQMTRSHAPFLPRHHSHTLRQLLSNRGGVRHYINFDPVNGGVFGSPGQYETATEAVWLFAADPLWVPVGTYSYSTHGWTVLATALEMANAGESISSLLRTKLAEPLDIPTLRAEDTSVANSERAAIYAANRGRANPDNLSWKVAGGGCEISTLDLARLGMKIVEGQAMTNARRTQMWTPPTGGSYALGWDSVGSGANRFLRHGGMQLGARSEWRIYPNRRLVIAIMSNWEGHSPSALAANIATVLP